MCVQEMECGSTIKLKLYHLWQGGHNWKTSWWNKPHSSSFLSNDLSQVETRTVVLTVDESCTTIPGA